MRVSKEQYAEILARRGRKPDGAHSPVRKPKIRQSSKGPNKTEQRFADEFLVNAVRIGRLKRFEFQPITLRLANGVRYIPDYWAVDAEGDTIFYEVKGGYIREDAIIKLKVAASEFPEYDFWLCVWAGGEWSMTQVRKQFIY